MGGLTGRGIAKVKPDRAVCDQVSGFGANACRNTSSGSGLCLIRQGAKVCDRVRLHRLYKRVSQASEVPIFHSLRRIGAGAHRLGSPLISPRLCAKKEPTLIYTREPQELSRNSGAIRELDRYSLLRQTTDERWIEDQ